MEALPYYKWHWQDWRANRRVQRMPWQAKGVYRELLDEFWSEGSLPTDRESLADLVPMPVKEFDKWWAHVSPCFVERGGRLYNDKMDRQRNDSDKKRVANARAGKAGGVAKLANASERQANDCRAEANVFAAQAIDLEPQRMPSERHIQDKTRLEESMPPEAVATHFFSITKTSGRDARMAIDDLARIEAKAGTDLVQFTERLIASWQDLEANRSKLAFHVSPAKFIADGLYRDRSAWPWKQGHAPAVAHDDGEDLLTQQRKRYGGAQ